MATEPENTPERWTQEQLSTIGQLSELANRTLNTADTNIEFARALLEEASAVVDMLDNPDADPALELRAQLKNQFGLYYLRNGETDKACDAHREASEICETLIDHGAAFRTNTAATYINLAGALVTAEKIDEAFVAIERGTELVASYIDENPDNQDALFLGFGAFHARSLIEIRREHYDEADRCAQVAFEYVNRTTEHDIMHALQAGNCFQQIAANFFNAEELDKAIYWGQKSDELARVAFDIEKEPAVPLFVQTQLFLILFHENKGNYSAAEDALYNAIDVIGNHPQLLERGRQFYQQCRKQTDKRLEEGGLPREEVEEGVSEIESRIEAFGGPEKLAAALAELEHLS